MGAKNCQERSRNIVIEPFATNSTNYLEWEVVTCNRAGAFLAGDESRYGLARLSRLHGLAAVLRVFVDAIEICPIMK